MHSADYNYKKSKQKNYSLKEYRKFAESFAKQVIKTLQSKKNASKTPSVVFLEGNLGAGKTTFSKHFCQFLGVDIDAVQSPSFNILNIYQANNNLNNKEIFHWDLYRIKGLYELIELDFYDLICSKIHIIEWGSKVLNLQEFIGKYKSQINIFQIDITYPDVYTKKNTYRQIQYFIY